MAGFRAKTGFDDGGIDRQEAARALALLMAPDGWHEVTTIPSRRASCGWFAGKDVEAAVKHAAALNGKAWEKGVYVTLNPTAAAVDGQCKDADVSVRRWLFLDIDAHEKGKNATEEMRDRARDTTERCREWLVSEKGWPEPVIVDSGNGFYLLFRLDDIPADAVSRAVVHRATQAIGAVYGLQVDAKVTNAGRICRVPGTLNRKGPEEPGRPQRACRLESVPHEPECVPWAKVQEMAGPEPGPRKATPKGNGFKAKTGGKKAEGPDVRERAAAYLRKTPPSVEGQKGSDVAYWAARVVVYGFDMGAEGGLSFLLSEWNHWQQPPWPEKELRHKCEDADAKPFDKPRGWLLADEPATQAERGKPDENGEAPAWSFQFDGVPALEGDPDEVRGGVVSQASGEAEGPKTRVFDIRSLSSLMSMKFPPPRWLINGIMSEGLNLLVGSPKQGKSVLALNLALTIAGGGKALQNVPVEAAAVLYISLEDKFRRVQYRATQMLAALPAEVQEAAGGRLRIATDWPRQNEGGLKMVDLWMARARNPGLVIIDVWGRFRPPEKAGGAYQQDSDAVSAVKQFCDARGIAGLVVHHDRKAAPGGKAEEDFVASISGTQGIAGSADGIMVLVRNRNERQAQLKVTGRDVDEKEIVLEFDPLTLTWKSLGNSEQHIEGKVQTAVVDYLKARGSYGASAPEVADGVKEKPDSVRRALNRLLAERVVSKKGQLWYFPSEYSV